MRIVYASALGAALLFGASAAPAGPLGDTGIYVNLGYGSLKGGQITTGEITGRVGARFGTYFGVEGEVNVGLGEHTYIWPLCNNPTCPIFTALLKAKLDNAEAAYAVGFLPVLPNADLFVRVGYGTSHFSTKGIVGQSFSPQGVNIGAGAQYFIDDANGLRFDYTHSSFNDTNSFGEAAVGDSANVWSIAYTRKL